MPACLLSFRAKCGGFLWIFLSFMRKRVVHYQVSFVRTLRFHSMRLSLAFVMVMATLLERCGDVEKNPGPGSKQTRLQTNNRSLSIDNVDKSSTEEHSLGDVMKKLNRMCGGVSDQCDSPNSRFDSLDDHVSLLRDEVKHLNKETENAKRENEQLKKENCDLLKDFLRLKTKWMI